jgi:quinol monooxygenase YgiN
MDGTENLNKETCSNNKLSIKKTKNIKMMLQHHLDHSLERDGCLSYNVFGCLEIKK